MQDLARHFEVWVISEQVEQFSAQQCFARTDLPGYLDKPFARLQRHQHRHRQQRESVSGQPAKVSR